MVIGSIPRIFQCQLERYNAFRNVHPKLLILARSDVQIRLRVCLELMSIAFSSILSVKRFMSRSIWSASAWQVLITVRHDPVGPGLPQYTPARTRLSCGFSPRGTSSSNKSYVFLIRGIPRENENIRYSPARAEIESADDVRPQTLHVQLITERRAKGNGGFGACHQGQPQQWSHGKHPGF